VAEPATGVELNLMIRVMELRVLPVIGAAEDYKFPRSIGSHWIGIVHR
jgi:hypothetical protein